MDSSIPKGGELKYSAFIVGEAPMSMALTGFVLWSSKNLPAYVSVGKPRGYARRAHPMTITSPGHKCVIDRAELSDCPGDVSTMCPDDRSFYGSRRVFIIFTKIVQSSNNSIWCQGKRRCNNNNRLSCNCILPGASTV